MNLYLPIAEMPVNIFVFLGMGGAVGSSGLFGLVALLMTPLLISTVFRLCRSRHRGSPDRRLLRFRCYCSVATQQRRHKDGHRAVDEVLSDLSSALRRSSSSVRSVSSSLLSVAYVTFLGIIGVLMLMESANAIRKSRQGKALPSSVRASISGCTSCR